MSTVTLSNASDFALDFRTALYRNKQMNAIKKAFKKNISKVSSANYHTKTIVFADGSSATWNSSDWVIII